VRDTALEAVKATDFERVPRRKPTASLRLDKRLITLRGEHVSVSCIGKRAKTSLAIPEPFKEVVKTWKFVGATLVYKRHERKLWLHLTFKLEKPDLQTEQDTLGIDLGLRHLAVTSDGDMYSNAKVRAVQRRYLHNRRTLQAKGTRSAKRRLRAMSGREQRFSRDVTHGVTKRLVQQENVTTLVLEDLAGIRNKWRGRKLNKHIGSWPFGLFKMFLAYKAEALGKRVVVINPRYTSQKCNACGLIDKGNRHKSRFCCIHCGFRTHADLNAAMNIRDIHLLSATPCATAEQAVVGQPNATGAG
jgi:IS605 OrfB family transposase